MIDMSCYELVVIYDKEYGEVIAFESDRFMNDSNDIVNEVISVKLSPQYILQEIHRYIPESRKYNKSIKELFCMYFRRVLRYKSRKPGIYTHFDEHMQNVIVMEFYKRVIQAYINYENCGDMPATH